MSHKEHNQQAEEQIKRDVEKHGWHVAMFEADTATPSFAYTIGLWKNFKQPEIIAFGLPIDLLHALLNDAGEMIKKNEKLTLNADNFDFLQELPVQFRQVEEENIVDYFGYARWYYDYKPFPAIQLIWPDRNSHYPWDEQFDGRYEFSQPLLENRLDFKFFEPRRVAVFVARQIFKEGKPIRRVRHDEDDGAWQFLTGEPVTTDDIMVVALEEVVKHDPTVNALFDMPTGQVATREFVGDKWVREEVEEEDKD